jgi:hypothetical protein
MAFDTASNGNALALETESQEEKERGMTATLEHERDLCTQLIRRVVAAHPNILSQKDVHVYERDVFSDFALAVGGYTDLEDKIKALREMRQRWIPMLAEQAPILERKFRDKMEEAIRNKWIGRRSATRWMSRLSADNAYYMEKKSFIEDAEKFPAYLKRWQDVAEKRQKLVAHPSFERLKLTDVPNLNLLKNEEDFLNRPYEERVHLVAILNAALAAKSKEMDQLFSKAKAQLRGAASAKAMSWNKIGPWLEKIFKSNAKPELIDDFLSNRGAMPLQKLIANWTEASKRFQEIEKDRSAKGTPRGVHFVSLEVFLNWRYEQRTAYLKHTEESMEALEEEDESLLQIRHELSAGDWESAEALIEKIDRDRLSDKQHTRLQSMEKYFREHGTKSLKTEAANTGRSPVVIIREIENLLGHVPPQLTMFYRKALSRGYQSFWAWTTCMYNRVWCHQNNFLSEEREQAMEREAKQQTRDRIRNGHSKRGTEANIIKDDTNVPSEQFPQ